MQFVTFIVNQVLREPSIFLGLIVLLGGLFLKRMFKDVFVSTIKTIVGVRILQGGAGILVGAARPMMEMILARFGVGGRVADPWTAVGEGLERMDPALVGQIGLIMILAWLLHLLLSRLTPIKTVYLTGHVAFTDTVIITASVFFITQWTDWRAIALAIGLLGVYWWLGPALFRPFAKKLVGDNPITVGHNLVYGGMLACWIAKVTGNVEDSAEEMEFPGWLSIFSDSVIAYSLIMAILFVTIGLVTGPEVASQFAGGKNYILFSFMQGIEIAVGVTILLLGVRMFLAELLPAFKGFADVVVPGAVAALDTPVFWPYALKAGLLGLIVTPFGMLVGILTQVLFGASFIVIPSVIPIFFGGTTLGVFTNAWGGKRGTIISTFLMGILLIWGNYFFAKVVGFEIGSGGHIDFATYWPLLFTIIKLPFGL